MRRTSRIRLYGAGRSTVAALVAVVVLAACSTGDTGDGQEALPAPPLAAAARPLDAGLVELGGPLYATNCAACHGANGEGAPEWRTSGPDGLFPPPPHDASGHTWHHADGLLYRIVRDGCAVYQIGTTPCGMPAFGDNLDDREIRAVIEFLRGWWGPRERAFQETVTGNDPFP